MNKPKSTKITVVKTDKLNQRKLVRIARRFNISPMSVRELQLGFPETLSRAAAEALIIAGYVKKVKSKKEVRNNTTRIKDYSTNNTKSIVAEDKNTVIINNDVENNDNTNNNKKEIL